MAFLRTFVLVFTLVVAICASSALGRRAHQQQYQASRTSATRSKFGALAAPVAPPSAADTCATSTTVNRTAAILLLNATLLSVTPGCLVATAFINAQYDYPYASCLETVTCQNRSTPLSDVVGACCNNGSVDGNVDEWPTNIFSNPFWWICANRCPRIWTNEVYEGRDITLFVEVNPVDYSNTSAALNTQGKIAFGSPQTFTPDDVNATTSYASGWIFVEDSWDTASGNSTYRRTTFWMEVTYFGDQTLCANATCKDAIGFGFSNQNTTAGYAYVFDIKTGATQIIEDAPVVFDEWNHFMATLSNGTIDVYCNGVNIFNVTNVTMSAAPMFQPNTIRDVKIQTELFNYTYQAHYADVSVGYAITEDTPESPDGLDDIPTDVTILTDQSLSNVTHIGGFLLNWGGILNVPTDRSVSGNMTITEGYRGAGLAPVITLTARTGAVLIINGPTTSSTATELIISGIAPVASNENILLIDMSQGSGASATGDFVLEGGSTNLTLGGLVYSLSFNDTTRQWSLVSGPQLTPGAIVGTVIGVVFGTAIMIVIIVYAASKCNAAKKPSYLPMSKMF